MCHSADGIGEDPGILMQSDRAGVSDSMPPHCSMRGKEMTAQSANKEHLLGACTNGAGSVAYQLGNVPYNSAVSAVPLGSSQLAAIRSAIIRSHRLNLWQRAAAGSHQTDHRVGGFADELNGCGGIDVQGWMQA